MSGTDWTAEYTSFDLPRSITRNGQQTSFDYDAAGTRAAKTYSNGSTVYIGKLYERRTQGSTVKHVFHVFGADGQVAQVTWDDGATTNQRINYVLPDHLGSSETITDASGNVIERLMFDPWGARIDAAGNRPTTFNGNVPHGFTAHESDDDLGLINMNGRIYDPTSAQFLTPDPIIESIFDRAGLNAYSYVMNNPVSYIDPSGFSSSETEYGATAIVPSWQHFLPEGRDFGPLTLRPGQGWTLVFDSMDSSSFERRGNPPHQSMAADSQGTEQPRVQQVARGGANFTGGPPPSFRHNPFPRLRDEEKDSQPEQSDKFGPSHTGSRNARPTDNLPSGGGVAGGGAAAGAARAGAAARAAATARATASRTAARRTTTRSSAGRAGAARGPSHAGAMARARYVPSDKHRSSPRMTMRGVSGAGPKNGQAALDYAVDVGNGSRRVGIDYATGEFVVFDQTNNVASRFPEFHGHVRTWQQLTPQMRSALQQAGMTDARGRILTGP